MSGGSLSNQIADKEAILHLKQSIHSGKQWYIALLEAIGLWGSAEEVYDGQTYHYLIAGEAFDWLSLAERLCSEVDGIIPDEEKSNLLFFATPPIELSPKEFRRLLGEVKYRAYLNYLYGVIVEEALILAVEEEVYKEQRNFALHQEDLVQKETYHRIYNTDMATLLHQFRNERGHRQCKSITLTERKEFTYWLFKYRLKQCEKARIASDTRKALQYLQYQWASRIKKKPCRALPDYYQL